MSIHDTDLVSLFSGRVTPDSKNRADIEVILLSRTENALLIRNDDDAPKRWIPSKGIRVMATRGPLAILRMSENKAIDLNLA